MGKHAFILGRKGKFSSFFSWWSFPWSGTFPGGELVRGNYALGDFAIVFIRNSFYISYFLFAASILHMELLRVIVVGKFSPGLNCLEEISVGRVFLPGGGARFSGII